MRVSSRMRESSHPDDAPAPHDDAAWIHYGDTILAVATTPGRVEIDLRAPVSANVAGVLRDAARERAFGVLTPYNPGGETLDDDENRARLRALERDLDARRLPWFAADGHGASSAHVEHGVAVVADMATVRTLSAREGQTAFFWFDGERFWLVPTRPDAAPVALPATPDDLRRVHW